MAGYTRQSTADIIPTATVRAAPLNAEYNAIRDAFAASGGHKHDGTTAEGEYVPLISDLDNYNKVVIDSTNNRVGVFVEVSSAAVEQVRFQDGAIVPVTTNDIDLGTSSLKFKDLYIEGTSTIGTVDIDGGNIDGTVIGATTAAAADFTTMDASGNATVGGTFAVTGNTTVGGTLGVTGVTTLGTANITSVDLDSGAIDNTTIGATTAAAGTFTTLTANTSLTAATADINGGTLDGVIIGGASSAAATVTDLSATGTSTLTTVDINGGAIDGTTIGASSAAAGSFTTVSTSGQATLATADINGGTIDGTTIGATTAAAITGTTITGTSFVGPVTGNVTGNLTGDVTGDLTGDVTGNITSSGSSSFNNVTIDGTLNMNAGTTATITNLTAPSSDLDAATKKYVDDEIAGLVDSAPGTLDTLNELAAALDDDPNFSTTITNSIATKLPLAGGTMTGAIAMSTNKITGLGDPTAAQDAMTKAYADATYLALSGGTMTGAIDMGSQKITTTYTPTNAADLTTKTYVDGILGSATAASASAAAAATSETNAATSETNAATSASNAATDRTTVENIYDDFDDRYLGAKASAPTLDNDGDALVIGALYFNTTTNIMNVYGSGGWQSAGSAVNGTSDRVTYTATSGQTVFSATYDSGYVDVYLNGVKLLAGTDFTATNGTSITLASGAAVNDIVDIVAYGTFVLADHYSKTQSDARYVEVAGDTMTGDLDITGTLTSDGLTVAGDAIVQTGAGTLTIDAFGGGSVQVSSNGAYKHISTLSSGYHLFEVNSKSVAKFNNTGDISFYEDTGTTAKFFWDASAERLGIGTSSPQRMLHINSGAADVSARFESTDELAQIEFYDNTSTNVNSIGAIGNDLLFKTNNAERMRIDSSGNLNLVSSSSGLIDFNFTDASLNDYARIEGGKSGSGVGDLRFHTYSGGLSEAMRIDSSGNLLVGTTDADVGGSVTGVRLAPNGSILASTDETDTIGNAPFYGDRRGTNNAGDILGLALGGFYKASIGVLGTNSGSNNGGITFNTISNNVTKEERMRIDSSGKLLVGKTSGGNTNTPGFEVQQSGFVGICGDGIRPFQINRQTSDGDIIELRKDGSTVGSIGATSNDLYIGEGDTGLKFDAEFEAIVPFNTSTLANRDQSIDLGYSNPRFRNLWLSGGVYLGGTGSANKLDDYEEGTWTPTYSTSGGGESVTYTTGSRVGIYTKIGNLVTCHFNLDIASSTNQGSGDITITGLPFATGSTASTSNYSRTAFSTYGIDYDSTDGTQMHLYIPTTNVTKMGILYSRDNAAWAVGTTSNFLIGSGRAIIVAGSFSYYTDA